ncbi:hypothetical protein [Azonexus sp. R2A61]|uniref:hypothetical protein n=1 Tax=Azonexus sp. R2A61 TaxID=2744443 RepID=UPI001F36F6B7|nr:hypothetical protein [Azonexus sp. R2A61]
MNPAIYPADLAALTAQRAGEKYRPSNGTESECFFAAWCRKCQRDKSMREGVDVDECDDNERCDLIARTFVFDVEDAEYPTEWQYGKDGQPCCTAFVPAGDPIPTPRCTKTLELF